MSQTAPTRGEPSSGSPPTLPRSTGHLGRCLPARLLTAPPSDLLATSTSSAIPGEEREADRLHRIGKALPLAYCYRSSQTVENLTTLSTCRLVRASSGAETEEGRPGCAASSTALGGRLALAYTGNGRCLPCSVTTGSPAVLCRRHLAWRSA